MQTTYTKRAKGGYYATTDDPDFFCTVERVYTFTMPSATRQWVAHYRSTTAFGDSRKDAVEALIRKRLGDGAP